MRQSFPLWNSGAGLQKDRDRGTTGPKEGLSPIGRFGLKGEICCQLFSFSNNVIMWEAQKSLLEL